MRSYFNSIIISGVLSLSCICPSFAQEKPKPQWPEITQQTKPWTRWWWMGSAVNPEELTSLLEQYQEAGLGGVEITPIYGVKGYEEHFLDFLSPQWMEMLIHTIDESERLDMGVDMAQASGWPFGGPWVSKENASKYVAYKTWSLQGGENLEEPVRYIQEPIVRAVGKDIAISELEEPIAQNPDLQLHAFDQVRFQEPLPLTTLMAYSTDGQAIELTDKVNDEGILNWEAPSGEWELYAIFRGWHGKMVERAGPGGEGYVIDHFSEEATEEYLKRFDEAFEGYDISGIRAFFNDSYEVDDAAGEANWTSEMFEKFEDHQGYDLRKHLPALFGEGTEEKNRRVLNDYRETISELILENYTREWDEWASEHNALIRNQAHGSPANILDLYAATDIPEIEGREIQRIKFASSAAHVTGKPLTSSESATWANEHFLSSLGDIKKAMDLYLLGGVNHTFYHGTNYSPIEAAWPGWLFYAAVHFNPNNTFWKDFSKLNDYVARSQSFLQDGKPDNDILLYLPIYDAFSNPTRSLLQHFDGIDHGFRGSGFEASAETMYDKGYSYDFISDKQILGVEEEEGDLETGGISYETILIPDARLIPLKTIQKLLKLAEDGATILVYKNLPEDVPGLGDLEERQRLFKDLLGQLNFTSTNNPDVQKAEFGEGRFLIGDDLHNVLEAAGIKRETMADQGLEYIRRKTDNGYYYFLTNPTEKPIQGWVPLAKDAEAIAVFNPMTGEKGYAPIQNNKAGGSEVYLQLAAGESNILSTREEKIDGAFYPYYEPVGKTTKIDGNWIIDFAQGGPKLPSDIKTSNLQSWTEFEGEDVKNFSGTAKYEISFQKPKGKADAWTLDLGQVEESARVVLNGKELATLIGPTYQVTIPDAKLQQKNVLEIFVSGSMANRIAYMDRNDIYWKKFYNINISNRKPENRGDDGNFSAAKWKPRPSGLIGPVVLAPVDKITEFSG